MEGGREGGGVNRLYLLNRAVSASALFAVQLNTEMDRPKLPEIKEGKKTTSYKSYAQKHIN